MKGFWLAYNYLRIGILNEFQYRANLYIQILETGIALVTGLVGLNLVFSQTSNLGGWSKPELLAVLGIFTMMGGVIRAAIQPNMERLMDDIQEGTLDYALTKPADAQLLISVREFRLWHMVDVIVGGVILFIALSQLNWSLTVWETLAFLSALFMGAITIYCFWLIITSTAFWFVRVHEIANLFEGLYAAGRWPIDIYPNWLRYGLTFLVPIAFAISVPSQALTSRLTVQAWFGAFAFTIFIFLLARFILQQGLKNYSGASA